MASAEGRYPASCLYEELDRAMWITKHSRFNASDRLRKKHILSIYTISILSIYVLVLSLLNKYGFSVENCQIFELLSVLLAIFILMLSLTEAGKNYMVASERLFVSGNEIRDLLDELKKYSKQNDDDIVHIESLSCKYSHVLKACGENHETIDYDLLRAQRPNDFNGMNRFYAFWFQFKYALNITWFYFALIFLPPLVFWKFS